MKEWWSKLGLREKQLILLGGSIASVLIMYWILWRPLSHVVAQLRNDITQGQNTLPWMQVADKKMTELESRLKTRESRRPTAILSTLQTLLKSSPFSTKYSQLQQVEESSASVTLKDVNFDTLTTWLIQLWNEHDLLVTQATVQSTQTPGIVNATLVIAPG